MKNKFQTTASRMVSLLLAGAMLLTMLPGLPTVRAEEQDQPQDGVYVPTYIKELEGLKPDYLGQLDSSVAFRLPETIRDDQLISIIITTDDACLMDTYPGGEMSFREYALESQDAQALSLELNRERELLLQKLREQNIPCALGEEYSAVLCGFELQITARDFQATCAALGQGQKAILGEEYRRCETQLVENEVNVYDTGIFNSANVPYDGTGMVVAVLDTGLDSAHSAFSVDNFTSDHLGLTYEDVAAVLPDTRAYAQSEGLSVDDVYINTKVPFGYDYADNDPDVYSTHNNHGTHVSGVIVGKDDTITGVAPNAQLVSMKIFSDVMDTARSAWILAALEDCVILGVDVINMSLGTSAGFSRESDEEVINGVYDKIRASGISVVAAASNSYSSAYGSEANGNLPLTSNPDTGTVGSPSTYGGVLSVASISGTETPYLLFGQTIIYFDESNSGSAQENDFCQTLLGDKEEMEIEYVIIPGVGRSADYTGTDVKGKIALVRRGDNTFEEKAMIAEAQGAAGIIVYNNVSGEIKMNVGDAKLAACSISQDDGKVLVDAGNGKIKISRKQTSGPFISDFSSWGPTPDLRIKPEITGHGGNILSAITGGGYDRLSGTSMACPNLAGVVVLLRQYVVENFPDIADDPKAVSAMVYKLLMSTADIALNTNGLPYAVRKQGAGLANLLDATKTPAYITTMGTDGAEMDKTKLELGDDPQKTGVYEMTFNIHNIGSQSLSYQLGAYVMTEGVSQTKTNAGETTVTEEAVLLDGAAVKVSSVTGGSLSDKTITVEAGKKAAVKVTITLTEANKQYLDESFENGMYVEGYLTLTATAGTDIDLNVPYLAFYGDWTRAPLFDLEFYETNADELDDGLDEEDKLKADAYATRLIGGLQGDYVSYLGSYYFLKGEDDMVIPADKKYISLSNQEGTIHALRYCWTGMLRSASEVKVTITNDATGEVVFETVDTMVRKSYGDGGSIYPANVEIEFDTMDYNLANNSAYTVRLEGTLDYGDGGVANNEKRVYEYPLVVDFQAPTVSDVEFTWEYDKSEKRNRLFAKVGIYDNHYAMSAQLGYVTMVSDADGNETATLKPFEQYMDPVYSEYNDTTYVTLELTDYIYELKNKPINGSCFVVTCYDYALNYATYEIGLPDNFTDFYFEGLEEGITLSPNEVFSLTPVVAPDTQWAELLEFTSSKPSVARIVNNKLVACASGTAMVKIRDPRTNQSQTFKVTVLAEEDEGYRRYDKPVADTFQLLGYNTLKAYYMLSSEDKLIGDTGDTRFFEGNYSLEMYPSESVLLNYKLDAYFPRDTKVEYSTSNEEIVTITESGIVTAVKEGFASVTMKVLMDDRSTYYSQTVSVEVKDPYVTTGASLTHYYGNGGVVIIPEDLDLTEIGNFAFSNFDYVEKTPEELAFDDAETSKQWYIGDSTITKVIIPEGVEKINAYAFAMLTGLEEVVLPSTLEFIEYGAFYGCSSLTKISFSGENNLKVINKNAFENCNLKGTLDLSSICNISDYAFAGNKELEAVVTGDDLLTVGQYAFAGCKKLADVTVTAPKVKYGAYAFTDCEALTEFTVHAAVLPEGMFYECRSLRKVVIGPDVNEVGEFAFRDTKVDTFEVLAGNRAFQAGSKGFILSADGKTLVAVNPTVRDTFSAENLGGAEVTAIGDGAFSHNTRITCVSLPQVTRVGDYAFGSSDSLEQVELGSLEAIGQYAFFETAITQMPSFTTETAIGSYAFAFTKLQSVEIPDDMTIPEGAFAECMELESVTVGNRVIIGDYAFSVDKDHSFQIRSYDLGKEKAGEEPEETPKQESTGSADFDNQIEGKDQEETPVVTDKGKRFYYELSTALTSLSIGDDALIGENAFGGAASLESVTLGANATIGKMAFYNNSRLKNIDLSKAKAIGDYAFSGDVYYLCLDDSMSVAAISPEGQYIFTYHAPALTEVNLESAENVGEFAFAYCRGLESVSLNDAITELKQYAFAGCIALKNIDLSKVVTLGDYAFNEATALETVDLSSAQSVGKYAFVYGENLQEVTFNPQGTDIGEGAFSYSQKLTQVENLGASKVIGDYAFAYTGITEADLTGVQELGIAVFLKEELTPFAVTLGNDLQKLGDNPFALCQVDLTRVDTEAGTTSQTYEISDTVFVENGSLYCRVNNGLELITYAGPASKSYCVADGTVRISAMAFAGSNVKLVSLPYTVQAIGHKAFYDCRDLTMVVLGSYNAPHLEEEFDPSYYDSLEHIPGSGDFGSYTDFSGREVTIEPMNLVPYFMWNATGGMYSNAFYGASFVDYVGYVENKLTMVRPINGQNYDSFIWNQYFDLALDGPTAPDDNTLAAIAAIDALGDRVTYEDKADVEAARAAYAKVGSLEQQALVTNHADLISAEQRILALTPAEEPEQEPQQPQTEKRTGNVWLWLLLVVLMALAVSVPFWFCFVQPVFQKLHRWLSPKMEKVKRLLSEKWNALLAVLKKFFLPRLEAVKRFILPKWETVKQFCAPRLAAAGSFLVAGFGSLAQKLKQKISRETVFTVEEEDTEEELFQEEPADELQPDPAQFQAQQKRKALVRRILMGVGLAVAAVAAVLVILALVKAFGRDKTPYQINDGDNFSVSVKYDANGGIFTTNTTVIVDSYNISQVPQENGKTSIALISPDHAARGKTDSFQAVRNDYFLAGWYQERTDTGYAQPWDFQKDRLQVDVGGSYCAQEPVLTLYAAWVPLFCVEFVDIQTQQLLDTVTMNPNENLTLNIPQWDLKSGEMELHDFPDRSGYTFRAAYYDAEGSQPVEGQTLTHPGQVDLSTGTARNGTLTLYLDYQEGEWYHIYNAGQFADNASPVGNYVLYDDLDFSDENWPTMLMHGEFSGTIQGNGHTIRNVSIRQSNTSKKNAGLFGSLTDTAKLENVTFENITFTIAGGTRAVDARFGLLAGVISGDATLNEVAVKNGLLVVDAKAYFANDSYLIGLLCADGGRELDFSGIRCELQGESDPAREITVDENGMVTIRETQPEE